MTDPQFEGMTLARRLAQGPLEPDKALSILEQLLRSLGASHDAGLVHGSISPQNIILTPDGKATLVGFPGRDPGAEPMARFAKGAAAPGYVAPEQIADDPVGRRADIYSLGVVAYAMLTGKDPFGAADGVAADNVFYRILYKPTPRVPEAAVVGLPASVGPAIDRAMAKEPQSRFTDAKSFLQELRVDAAVVPAPAPPKPKQVKREAEQRAREEEKKKRNAEKLAAGALAAEKLEEENLKKQKLAAFKQEEKERKQREKAAAAWGGASAASKGGGWSRKTLALAAGVIILLLLIGVGAAFAMGAIGGSPGTTLAAAIDTTTTQTAAVDDSTTTTTEPMTTTTGTTNSAQTTTTATVTTTTLPPSSTTLSTVSSTTTTKRTTTTVKPTTTTKRTTTTTVKPTTTTIKPTTTTVIVKKKATITVVQRVFAYDGAPHHLIITATGEGGVDLTSLVDPGGSKTEIGDYTITWSFAGNANYESDSRAAILSIQ